MIGVNRENQDLIRAIQNPQSLAQSLRINEKIMRILIENATVLQVAAQNLKKRKMQKIRMISRYEKRRMVYKLKDLTEKPIRMTVVAIAIPVEKENQLLREEALRHVRTEVGPRTETEIGHGIDRETGHEIDRGIDHEIDHETGIEGKIYKSHESYL